jgi:hypothetical protein
MSLAPSACGTSPKFEVKNVHAIPVSDLGEAGRAQA